MSLIALFGGFLLYVLMRSYLARCEDGPPYFRRLRGQRLFRARSRDGVVAVGPSGGGAARHAQSPAPVALDRCRRLHCRQLAALFLGFRAPAECRLGHRSSLRLLWLIGMALAIGAAVSAKYHRLAGLIMLGGVGLVVCMTFIWLSAPDLAITQLLVEIVTTVLILLGLRWLPKRSPTLARL